MLRTPQMMKSEGGRVTALLAAEYLSSILEFALRIHFDKAGLTEDEQYSLLGEPFSPLGTLAGRAWLCHAFGLIGRDTRQLLDDMRAIRNCCAHSTEESPLDDKDIARQVKTIYDFAKAAHEAMAEALGVPNGKVLVDPADARDAIRITTNHIASMILSDAIEEGDLKLMWPTP